MESDWSVAAGADDPVIETGWADAASGLAWSDLRAGDMSVQQDRIAALPEVAASPALAAALVQLNAPDGLLTTTKCDRWAMSGAELSELAALLDARPAAAGFGSYIDILMSHTLPMADFLLHEEWARVSARRCAALGIEEARVELIVRPAHHADVWGFGLSVYCYGAGADAAAADSVWATCLQAVTPIVIQSAHELMPPAREISS